MRTNKQEIYNELLVLRCRRKEDGAMEELVGRWEKRLFYYIRRFIRNEKDAWDILQVIWIKVFKGINSLKNPEKLHLWLYRTTWNTINSYWRKKYSDRIIDESFEEVEYSEPDKGIIRFENSEQVHYGLNRLSPIHKTVLTLYFLENFSIAELAEILEISEGTVKSRLYYAKRTLKNILNEG
ncbi:RNA polymerase sigma factor [candidate division KSB1 bacterium]